MKSLRRTFVVLVLTIWPALAWAQEPSVVSRWWFQTSAIATGASESSNPEGYKVYTALAFEPGLKRDLSTRFAVRLTGTFESREVEFEPDTPNRSRLGALELFPLNAFVEWHPRSTGSVRPFLGAGANLSLFWEKSGALDSVGVSTSVGPALTAGLEFVLSDHSRCVVTYKWNKLSTDLTAEGERLATLNIHPSTFGAGVMFRF